MKRNSIRLALAIVAWAAVSGTVLRAQDREPAYSPEGAWLGSASFPFSPIPFPFMDIYQANSNERARSGTVLCTQPSGKSWSPPLGIYVTTTVSAHGSWVRIEKNRYAVTAWRILLNFDTNAAVGYVKFMTTITMQTSDSFTGTMTVEYYGLDGTLLNRLQGGATTGTRIAADIPPES